MQHILVAPNAFKQSLDAFSAAEAVGSGFMQSQMDCRVTLFPVGDGGDGTCKLIHESLRGKLVKTTVSNPSGNFIEVSYSLVDKEDTAVIEMADASGLRLLKPEEQNPLFLSSKGTGELILHALDQGVSKIILGMGGSATVDGGCGMLHALGVRFWDQEGTVLEPIPYELQKLRYIDTAGIDKRLQHCHITILCDVDNPMLGVQGAANVFGFQKGASDKDIKTLETFLHKFCEIVLKATGKNIATMISGGTAGGAAGGLYAFANAELVNGIEEFLKITGFKEILKTADWVVTGEGSIDEQTLSGKGPFGVAQLAKRYHIPVIGLGGNIPSSPSSELLDYFDVLLPINHKVMPLDQAIECTATNLRRTAEAVGNLIAAVR